MLKSFSVSSIPCFSGSKPEPLTLKPVNFIFGPNGSGKSSIAREVQKIESSSEKDLKVLIYNRDYKDRIIQNSNSLKGLLTVGSDAIEAQQRLAEANRDLQVKERQLASTWEQITNPEAEQEGEKEKQDGYKQTISDLLWNRRLKEVPQEIRSGLYPGTTGSKESFKASIFPIITTTYEEGGPSENIQTLSDITQRYSQLQTIQGVQVSKIMPNFTELSVDEKVLNDLLSQPIIDEGDSEYARSISALEAGNWFARGLELLDKSESKCPFCQRELDEDLVLQIRQAFSDDYNRKIGLINDQKQLLESDLLILNQILNEIKFLEVLDSSGLENAVLSLRDFLVTVIKLIDTKKDSPAECFETVVFVEHSDPMFEQLMLLNASIQSLNEDAANYANLKRGLVSAAIPALISETWGEITPHLERFENSVKAEKALRKRVDRLKNDIDTLQTTIEDEAKRVRDSKVHLESINRLISFMVGDAFQLVETPAGEGDEPSNYKVVRTDGSPVGPFLSEGEEQLLGFLYFISEVWNIGEDGSDIPESRALVVIDDPMSSLDSDLLFGVSSLIINLIDGMKTGLYEIEQLICLSHNATFYNNLTYRFRESDERFQHFLIRKKSFGHNTVTALKNSPVTSVYANLWKSVQRAASDRNVDNVGLANTMRRILENYFSAGNSLSSLRELDGLGREEQVAINSLISWANSGSHNLMDSLEVGLPDTDVTTYLRVFEKIFDVTGHEAHYEMMMQ